MYRTPIRLSPPNPVVWQYGTNGRPESERRVTVDALVRPFVRPLGLSVVGLHATFATLGAVAAESAVSLATLVLTLVLAGAVGLHARGRGPLVPTVLGVGYTLAAAVAVAVAVPLGVLGPAPTDAFASLSWRTISSIVFFALFAGAPCYALAVVSLVGTDPRKRFAFDVD